MAAALVILALVLFVVLAVIGPVRPYPAWLIAWSIATFVAYAVDKTQARRGGWRIPEIVLHGLAVDRGRDRRLARPPAPAPQDPPPDLPARARDRPDRPARDRVRHRLVGPAGLVLPRHRGSARGYPSRA